jgi:hypothetical protein
MRKVKKKTHAKRLEPATSTPFLAAHNHQASHYLAILHYAAWVLFKAHRESWGWAAVAKSWALGLVDNAPDYVFLSLYFLFLLRL